MPTFGLYSGRYSQSVKNVGFGRRLAVTSWARFCWMLVRVASRLWLRWMARSMACSRVSWTDPATGWPKAVSTKAGQQNATTAARNALPLVFKGRLQFRKLISLAREPDIESGQDKDAHGQVGDQPAHNDDRERPLRVGPDRVRQGRGQQA